MFNLKYYPVTLNKGNHEVMEVQSRLLKILYFIDNLNFLPNCYYFCISYPIKPSFNIVIRYRKVNCHFCHFTPVLYNKLLFE